MADSTESINLGHVAFVDKGSYSDTTTYARFHFITTDDSCYLSLKDGNKGHALTETGWWKCIARGTQATEAAKKALEAVNGCNEAIANAEKATTGANNAAINAGASATRADAAAVTGNALILSLNEKEDTLDALIPQLRSAVQAALTAYDLITESESVNAFASIPASMVASVVSEAVLGSNPVIEKAVYPATANQSVIYQVAAGGGFVNPDGIITPPESAGQMVIYVIATMNTSVWREVRVTFRDLESRTMEDGTARTTEDGTAIEC